MDKDFPRDANTLPDLRLESGFSVETVVDCLKIGRHICELPRLLADGLMDAVRTFHARYEDLADEYRDPHKEVTID